ncbi:MAG: indole-3-glycerol phosphate synthase TrpC [Myxococcota bacterium]
MLTGVTVLERILAYKREEVRRASARLPAAVLAELLAGVSLPRDFVGALRDKDGVRIIAEIKRASPSRGVLRESLAGFEWRAEDIARQYDAAGAACLSVLTDVPSFWGCPDYLDAAREAVTIPVLRKEFIVDPYQVDESRWLGADAVLLMASVLDEASLHRCAARALELGMGVLVEVHTDDELPRALRVEAAVIGINHRDLRTLAIDADRALRLRDKIPADRLVVAESGLKTAADLQRLRAVGIHAFLIGSYLCAEADPGAALKHLITGCGA